KTIEHYTRACANGNHKTEMVTLDEALKQTANLVELVGVNAELQQTGLPETYVQELEQLDLFVMESKAEYDAGMRKSHKITIS
ncbi:MAG: hypothetical protein ACE5NG_14620, partial [bacterium]